MPNRPPIPMQVAEYAPDLPPYPAKGSRNILNVYPRTAVSYGAIPAPVPFSNALAARCQGASAFMDPLGNVTLFAGDASALYKIAPVDAYEWQNISISGGYTVDPEIMWEMEYFNGSVIATDYADPIQTLNLTTDTVFSELAASAPTAKHLAVVKNAFVVVGNTFDSSNGAMDQRVWWSAAGDAANWPTLGSELAAQLQSGATDLFGNVGPIQAIRSGLAACDALVFQRYAVKQMIYAGPPTVFDFIPAENLRGTPAPYSPVVVGGNVFYLGFDGWYASDGAGSKPIGADRVDKTFFADLDQAYFNRIVGASDPLNKLVWWAYPGADHDAFGNPNKILIYNWQLDRWSLVTVNCETLCRMMTMGYTLDQLYTLLGYTLDDLPAPLDSSVWLGAALRLGLFDPNHELNFFTGQNLAATVETEQVQPFPGQRALVRGIRPLIDGGTPLMSMNFQETLTGSVRTTGVRSPNALGIAPYRNSGRYMRSTLNFPLGQTWTNISGIELDAIPLGAR